MFLCFYFNIKPVYLCFYLCIIKTSPTPVTITTVRSPGAGAVRGPTGGLAFEGEDAVVFVGDRACFMDALLQCIAAIGRISGNGGALSAANTIGSDSGALIEASRVGGVKSLARARLLLDCLLHSMLKGRVGQADQDTRAVSHFILFCVFSPLIFFFFFDFF